MNSATSFGSSSSSLFRNPKSKDMTEAPEDGPGWGLRPSCLAHCLHTPHTMTGRLRVGESKHDLP